MRPATCMASPVMVVTMCAVAEQYSREEAYKERQGSLILVKVDPALDPLRSEPRFAKLVQKVGL